MCKDCNQTIHSAQHHFGWDSLAPAVRTDPRSTILCPCRISSVGQFTARSTVTYVAGQDFSRMNPVSGQIHIEGAEPGDAVKVEMQFCRVWLGVDGEHSRFWSAGRPFHRSRLAHLDR